MYIWVAAALLDFLFIIRIQKIGSVGAFLHNPQHQMIGLNTATYTRTSLKDLLLIDLCFAGSTANTFPLSTGTSNEIEGNL